MENELLKKGKMNEDLNKSVIEKFIKDIQETQDFLCWILSGDLSINDHAHEGFIRWADLQEIKNYFKDSIK